MCASIKIFELIPSLDFQEDWGKPFPLIPVLRLGKTAIIVERKVTHIIIKKGPRAFG